MKDNLSPEQFSAVLRGMEACGEALEWAEGLDYNTAWSTCGNPGWMFFLIKEVASFTLVVNELLICRFAREVVHFNPDPRVLACIEVREAWVRGKATDGERKVAISGTRDATMGAVGDAAYNSAWAAAEFAAESAALDAALAAAGSAAESAALDAALAAAGSAAESATLDAALAAGWVALGNDTAYDAATKTVRARQCDIIRELIAQPELV